MSSNRNSGETLSDEKIDDIVNRMAAKKPKRESDEINYDDVEFDKLDQATKKSYADLFSGLPDVYKIIGAKQDEPQESVNKKCAEKLRKYQPDRHSELVKKYPKDERPRELKKLNMQYSLIRDACSVLRDPAKRKYYDLQRKTVKSKNFVAQKTSFEEFVKLQDAAVNDQTKAIAKTNFDMSFLELDKKHGFDRKKFEEDPLTVEETSRRYEDLQMGRDSELIEIELKQKDMFDGKAFSEADFNKNWAKMKKREAKKNGRSNDDKSLMVWEGISASNDYGIGGSTDFVSVDNYEDLYSGNNHEKSSMFASRLDSGSESDSNSESDFNSDDEDFKYDRFDEHNKNKESTMLDFDAMMKRRQLEDDAYDKREMKDRNAWKSVFDNPMNISAGMGDILGGKDFKQLDGIKKKKTIGKEYAEVYQQLVYEGESDDEKLKVEKPKRTSRNKKSNK